MILKRVQPTHPITYENKNGKSGNQQSLNLSEAALNFTQRARGCWLLTQRQPSSSKVYFPSPHLKSSSHNPVGQWAVGYVHLTEEKTEIQREETRKKLHQRQKEIGLT